MRLGISLFAFFISTLLLLQRCGDTPQNLTGNYQEAISNPDKVVPPITTRIYMDSLIIRVPGENGIKPPVMSSTQKGDTIDFNMSATVIPGKSFLPQTIEEKFAGMAAIKSKKPEIIRIPTSKINSHGQEITVPPVVTRLPNILKTDADSLAGFYRQAIKSGLVTVQHQDSIFPPIAIIAPQPKQIAALPFRYKENAQFDLSFLDADQELPNSYIRGIAEDEKGIMWFGSHTGGLISYNGLSFKQYTTSNGLSSDMIYSFIKDKNNHFWIGTQDAGLNYFDGSKFIQYGKKQGLPSNVVLNLFEDHLGNIWIATTRGAAKFDGETFTTFTNEQGLPEKSVSVIYEDKSGNIWFGTQQNGISKFNGTHFLNFNTNDGLPANFILSITEDHQGHIWLGTNGGGASKFDGTSFTNYGIDQGLGGNTILSIVEDHHNNNLWFGTFGYGITRFDGNAFINYETSHGLNDNYVRCLYEDDQGNLWIGTDGGGISHFNFNSFVHITKEQGLSDNLVLSIFQDQKNFWLSVFDDGLLVVNNPDPLGKNCSFLRINDKQGLANNIVTSILETRDEDYWFGTFEGGISKMDGKDFESGKISFTNYSTDQGLPNNTVRKVLQDQKGDLWIASEGGITKFDGQKFYTLNNKNGLGTDEALCIFEEASGALWFGTMGAGVSRLYHDTLVRFTKDQGLADNTVWTIEQDHQGNLWFGTDGGGLSCFNGKTFRTFTKEEGLSNNYVFSIKRDNDNALWAGTTRGLTRILIPDSLNLSEDYFMNAKFVLINYNKMNGLFGVDFYTNSVFLDNADRMWWGTNKALTMLDLKGHKNSVNAPIAQIDNIIINDKSYVFNELKHSKDKYDQSKIQFTEVLPFVNLPVNLSLPHNFNHLTFQFSATDWSSPNQIQYEYMLKGVDKSWSPLSKDNEADYRNIYPGSYVFMVRAQGKSSLWGNVATYPFTIQWPWYFTWWAITVYALVFVFIIWLIIKWRVHTIQRQKTDLENTILLRTNELENAVKLAEQATIAKSQFIATVSHEIRTPLNAVMGLTHLALNTSLTEKQEDYLTKIDRSASTLLGLINDILDFSKIEAGKMHLEKANFDLEILLNSILTLNAQLASDKNLEFVVNIGNNVPNQLIGDSLRIGQVLTNLCNNAIKFTSFGEVVIQVDLGEKINEHEGHLKVSVKDTGIGISKEMIPHLFDEFKQADNSITRKYGGTGLGLSISKLLLEMMGGKIWVESEPGKGSTFYFTCKVGLQPESAIPKFTIPEDLKNIEILVCDDNPSALKSISDTLKSFSFNVVTATSGEEVIKIIDKNPPDLLMIDMQLPGISGLDTISAIRNNPSLRSVKTILIAETDYGRKLFEQNITVVDRYLSKPFLPSVVLETILYVYGKAKASHSNQKGRIIGIENLKKTLAGKKILLAEDNEINRQVVFELLDNIGIIIELADNGAIAVQKAINHPFDLILMDLHMPVMDGYGSAIQIRLQDIKVPILAITADAMVSIKTKCDEVGINGIITKPIDPELFYEQVSNWILKNKEIKFGYPAVGKKQKLDFADISTDDLDTKTGIRRFGYNELLYTNMLRKFIFSNNKTCSELRKLVSSGKYEEAHLLIHSLKGESGNIAADNVYKQSQIVEQAVLSQDMALFEKEMPLLEDKLKTITVALVSHFRNEWNPMDQSQKISKDTYYLLIENLKKKSPKALDQLDELATRGLDKSVLEAINEAVNNENMEEAIHLINNLAEDL
ncbi:MAG: two-component regulator propeller domain-containing protein [Bacteroidales bacterium]|jgi:signal transduction histidine kinase/ligand-binding sensor domain-containing protein/DNA-binding response OmpR family regulator